MTAEAQTKVQNKAHFKALAPKFLVMNLEEAIAFYTKKLGFSVEFKYASFH
jgi:catechol-2,3-dioxygenase